MNSFNSFTITATLNKLSRCVCVRVCVCCCCTLFSQQCAKGEFVNINCPSMIRVFSKQYFVIRFLFLENNNLKDNRKNTQFVHLPQMI